MTHHIDGKLALVIGGSGGIGAACVRLLAGSGARVALTHTARSADAAAALLASLPGAGHAAFAADIASTASLQALRAALEIYP